MTPLKNGDFPRNTLLAVAPLALSWLTLGLGAALLVLRLVDVIAEIPSDPQSTPIATALCLLLIGGGLTLATLENPFARTVAAVLAGAIGLISITGWIIEQPLLPAYLGYVPPIPATAVMAIALGLAMLHSRLDLSVSIAGIAGIFGFALAVIALAGHAIGDTALLGLGALEATPWPTSAAILISTFALFGHFLRRMSLGIKELRLNNARLTLLSTLSFFAIISIAVWVFIAWRDYIETGERIIAASSAAVRVMDEHAKRSLDPAYLALDQLSEMVEAKGLENVVSSREDWDYLRAMASRFPQISALAIIDSKGRSRFVTTRFPFGPVDVTSRDYYDAHARQNLPYFLGPSFIAHSTGRMVFSVTRRLNAANGDFAGIVLASLEVNYFQNFYRTLSPTGDMVAAMFTDDGRIIARDPLPPSMVGSNVSNSVLFTRHLTTAPVGAFVAPSPLDGERRLVAYRRSDQLPIIVTAGLPASQALAEWELRVLANSTALLTVLLMLAGLGWLQFQAIRREEQARRETAENHNFVQSVLNSVGSNIAILDPSGTIIGTNAAWVRFARENGFIGDPTCIGVDYLASLRSVRGADRNDAEKVIAGLLALRDGRAEQFVIDYPCHGPGLERWFNLRATPLRGSNGGIVLTHEDITAVKRAEQALTTMAASDSLTGLHNRRSFFVLGEREVSRSRHHNVPLSAILIDCDDFKRVNDAHGHEAGDQMLIALTATAQELLRETDIMARLGGEEFVILLPHTGLEAAALIAERLRAKVAETIIITGDSQISITISSGVVTRDDATQHLADLLRRADESLYQAKAKGGNRVAPLPAAKAPAGQ